MPESWGERMQWILKYLCADDESVTDSEVAGVWNSFLQDALIRNNSVDFVMSYASEAIALQMLHNIFEQCHEGVRRKRCDTDGDIDEIWGPPLCPPCNGILEDLLSTAVDRQFISCMSLLLENGVDSQRTGEGLLMLDSAIEAGNFAAVELLVHHGARLDSHVPRDYPPVP